MNFINTETQISPCIVSKVRFALNLKDNPPNQLKRKYCSIEYWKRSIDTVCQQKGINDHIRKQNAINKYHDLINN